RVLFRSVRRLDAARRGRLDDGRRQVSLRQLLGPILFTMNRRDELRRRALADMQEYEVLMIDGHFDYGNGYHGRVYLNPHRIFRQPSLIWRFAQDLIEVLPEEIVQRTQVVSGPVMGGALLAHTIAGLLDGRRSLTSPPHSFAPLSLDAHGGLVLRPFYRSVVQGKRVLLADAVC